MKWFKLRSGQVGLSSKPTCRQTENLAICLSSWKKWTPCAALGRPADANCIRSHLAEMQQRIRYGSSCIRRQIVQAAIRLHREIGFKKTTIADIARAASMSPANVYRFFPSKQAIEEAAVADLFEQVSAAATLAARGGSAPERLTAALRAISQLHEHRLKNDSKQHELVAAAVRENWAVALSYADWIPGARERDHCCRTGERRATTGKSDGNDPLPA